MIALIQSDACEIPLPDQSVHMIACSPPYWGLRDYGLGEKGIGLEDVPDCLAWTMPHERYCVNPTAKWWKRVYALRPRNCGQCYVCRLRKVASELWRVLRDDGTFWLNIADTYFGDSPARKKSADAFAEKWNKADTRSRGGSRRSAARIGSLKVKDLVGIPWRVALALQADGWWLRSDPPWIKTNCMPEPSEDRPTKAHEYVFVLTKKERYFWDPNAIRKEYGEATIQRNLYSRNTAERNSDGKAGYLSSKRETDEIIITANPAGRHRRTTDWWHESLDSAIAQTEQWLYHARQVHDDGGLLLNEDGEPLGFSVSTQGFSGAHFATWPEALVEPMIRASTSEAGVCGTCGAPWERVTSRDVLPPPDRQHNNDFKHDAMTTHGEGASTLRNILHRQTVGFRPTCAHDGDPVPATVLDAFCGSAATGVVARWLGQHFIGLDLSFEYLRYQARARLELDALEAFESGRRPMRLEATDDADYGKLPLFANIAMKDE